MCRVADERDAAARGVEAAAEVQLLHGEPPHQQAVRGRQRERPNVAGGELGAGLQRRGASRCVPRPAIGGGVPLNI